MNLRSLLTRTLVVASALLAFAFNGDDSSFTFSLSAEAIFYPGSPETGVQFSGNGVGTARVYMRAFRISDPVEFFLAQNDPHSPTLQALNPPNTFEMLNQGLDKVKRDMRYAARDVMPASSRRAIRDVADLNGTKAEKERQKNLKPVPNDPTRLAVDDIPKGAERYEIVATWEHQLTPKKEDEEGWHYESIPAPLKEKGVYLIEARVRGKRALTTLVVSELGMVVKQSSNELMTFVVNTRTGEKVSDVPLVVAREGGKLAEKQTDANGTFRMKVPPPPERPHTASDDEEDEWRWDYRSRLLLVLGEKDGNFLISDPYFYNYYGSGNARAYVHTDRPVYRPNHTVYYRGIFRNMNEDGTYALAPAGTRVVAEIEDARGDVVRRDTMGLSDVGTFNNQFVLGDEPPLGSWSVKVYRADESADNASWFSFSVEEYKKPEYKVVVTADRANYTRGDEIKALVKADYYFGSPVANATVEYFVYRSRYWRPWWRGSDWAYLYEDGDDDYATYRAEMVSSGKGVVNPDGTFAIAYKSDGTADQDYVYRIQANVVDNSRRVISGSKSVVVTRGSFYVSTSTDKYVYKPNDEAKVRVEIATFDGDRPVATPFNVRVIRTWWDKVRNDTIEGGYEYRKRTESIWGGNGATDAKGTGTVVYKPSQPGYFEVIVAAHDEHGTEITESNWIYVADQAYANWYREGSSDVQIIPDKPAYKPGETVSALVIMPAANIDALVTVEGSTIYSGTVERLSGTSAIVHVPVEERYAPTVYLSASAIVNEELYTETQRISVVPEGKLLHLEVTTDKATYRPGDKGTVMVRAVDEKGSPAANVDVAVGMVDEAIYAIRPENAPDIQRHFYASRWNDVSTSSSLNFSFYGDAVRMDKDATDALYGSAAGRRIQQDRLYASNGKAGARALAFGDVKGNMFVQPVTRKNFKDMMFWAPSVRTDADGRAQMSVDFPDNLTTWRITARGVTANTAVGQATTRVIARKELLVRMETPRFMIQGDELLVATTVHNYLSSPKVTKVQFGGENVQLADREQTITIPANGEQRVDWKIAARFNGTATLTVKALTNEESDAMELNVPVLPRGMRLATGAVTQLDATAGNRAMNLMLPTGADPGTADLYVSLSPSLAGSLLGALDSLIGYPYGCVEQTMSRFLPTVVVADALRKLDIPFDPKKRAELPKMVNRGFNRLYGMQHEDGGWGWWEHDNTNPFMTAYVVYGLTIAERAGYDVDDNRYESGVRSLKEQIAARPAGGGLGGADRTLHPTTEAYMLFVASFVAQGKPDKDLRARITALAARPEVNSYATALLALAAEYQKDRATATRLVDKLSAAAEVTETTARWPGKSWHYNWEDDVIETSAFAVKAILQLKGETPLAVKGTQWLLGQKIGDMWGNTRQTAMVVFALSDYINSSGQLSPDYNVAVKVNGRQLYTRHVTSADVFVPEQRVKLPATGLVQGNNVVTIEKSGTGKLYTSARLLYYATGPALRTSSAGFKVTREYYTLNKQRRGDVFVYTKEPFRGTVKSGEELFVKVRVVPDRRYEYFMLEDPLPAGCEVVENTNGYTIAGEPEYDEAARQKRGEWVWGWWYADRNVRDEKVTFFANEIAQKPYEFSYVLRAQIPGTYQVMPSVAALMYYTEVRGNSDALSMTITP